MQRPNPNHIFVRFALFLAGFFCFLIPALYVLPVLGTGLLSSSNEGQSWVALASFALVAMLLSSTPFLIAAFALSLLSFRYKKNVRALFLAAYTVFIVFNSPKSGFLQRQIHRSHYAEVEARYKKLELRFKEPVLVTGLDSWNDLILDDGFQVSISPVSPNTELIRLRLKNYVQEKVIGQKVRVVLVPIDRYYSMFRFQDELTKRDTVPPNPEALMSAEVYFNDQSLNKLFTQPSLNKTAEEQELDQLRCLETVVSFTDRYFHAEKDVFRFWSDKKTVTFSFR